MFGLTKRQVIVMIIVFGLLIVCGIICLIEAGRNKGIDEAVNTVVPTATVAVEATVMPDALPSKAVTVITPELTVTVAPTVTMPEPTTIVVSPPLDENGEVDELLGAGTPIH